MPAPRRSPARRPTTQRRAHELRRATTTAEQLVWNLVRDRRLGGLKFRRQHPLGPFIADFYCHEKRLVLELDGEEHELRRMEDAERSQYLATLKLSVFRICNEDVYSNLEGVSVGILRAAGVDVEQWSIEQERKRSSEGL